MGMIILTGSGRTATGVVAAATALRAATEGRKTLLASLGPAHALGGLLDRATGAEPQAYAPQLDVWLPDSLDTLGALWEQRRSAIGGAVAAIGGDELPTVPGSDLFVALSLLRAQVERYDLIVFDAGEYGTLLRSLALPDSFRWGLRLLIGLDRGPGRSPQSQARALVPLSLLPFEWLGQVQQARVETEELRDIATHSAGATVGFVLAPDAPSLREAQVAVPALQLYGLAVAALIVGPLLPDDIGDERLAPLIAQQRMVIAQTQELWSPRPLLSLPLIAATSDATQSLGDHLYAQTAPSQLFNAAPPLAVQPGPTLSLRLPLLQKGALRLTVSGDEIIVRVGAYRRHLLLPEGLRGATSIKATRSGDEVLISRRE